jgi:hypothetical protein
MSQSHPTIADAALTARSIAGHPGAQQAQEAPRPAASSDRSQPPVNGRSTITAPTRRQRSAPRSQQASQASPHHASPVGLAVRGYRCNGLQQVDLFWTGPRADGFDVYRDGRRIATISASGYTDRIGRDGSGSYRYRVGVTGTQTRSNEAAVTFRGAG